MKQKNTVITFISFMIFVLFIFVINSMMVNKVNQLDEPETKSILETNSVLKTIDMEPSVKGTLTKIVIDPDNDPLAPRVKETKKIPEENQPVQSAPIKVYEMSLEGDVFEG